MRRLLPQRPLSTLVSAFRLKIGNLGTPSLPFQQCLSSNMSSTVTKISDIPTLVDLYKNSHLHPTSPETPPTLPPSLALNSRISIIQKSITTLGVTSIVNAANTALLGGGGVDGAIHAAAGPALLEECRTLNGCPTGSAKVTSAYDLPSSYVIHAVGPIYARARREGPNRPAELLRSCYRTSLQLAAEKGGSVAFSCLSTGVYGYPINEAAEIATREVRRFLRDEESGARLERVVFCCFEGKDVKAYHEWLPKIFPPPPSDLSAPPDSSTSTASSAPLESSKAPGKGQPAEPIFKDVATDDWEAIEKPETTSQAQSTDSLNDDGEKIEGADVSNGEGEKIEFGDVNGSEALGRNEAVKSGLLKDW